jgi:ArsR family transcriptional regulator
LNISAFTDMFVSVMKELILVGKALADPTRVRILAALRDRELCVCELCDALQVSQSTLSTHLQVIRDAGLVRTRKQGKWTYYAPASGRERLTKALFDFFATDLHHDPGLRVDTQRIKARLAERANGACCRGFDEAPRAAGKRTRP